MRRRENKSSKDWDEYDEEGAYEQARRTATPDAYGQQPGMPTPNPAMDERPRSVSNASNTSYVPPPPPRRPSMDEIAQNYQSNAGYQPMAPPQPTGYSQMPQYGASQNQYQNHYSAPPPAAPMMPPAQSYSQAHQNHNSYTSQSNMPMGQSYGYMQNQSYQQPQYEQPAPVRQEPTVEYAQPTNEYRRPSIPQPTQQYPGPNSMIPPFSPMDQYNRPQQLNQQLQPLQTQNINPPVSAPGSMHMPNGHSLAPLKTLVPPPLEQKLEPVSPAYHSPPNTLSAPMSATSDSAQKHGYIDAARPPPTNKFVSQPPPSTLGQKRSFSSTFDTQHVNERLQQGARPNPAAYGYDGGYDEPDMEEPMDRHQMSYRRADGTQARRQVPDLGL